MLNKQKIAVIIPDGMADFKIPELDGKTPMEVAMKPCMDFLAQNGVCGMVKTIPEGKGMLADASATANLAILGYNPKVYSKGRSPLEAANIGLVMRTNDTAIRCNFVTLSENENVYEEKIIIDHSADEITTEESDILIKELDQKLGTGTIRFNTGVSYRNCLLWENFPGDCGFTPPHDILTKQIKNYLPSGEIGDIYLDLMKKSYDILNSHPVNIKRRENGKRPANSIWLWAPGTKPNLPGFTSKCRLDGSIVSAVDLIKGIGVCAGMKVVNVEGATGNFYTNYKNKGLAAIKEFKNGSDFVYIHIEAPDECGHQGDIGKKIKSIENIDEMIIKPVFEYLDSKCKDFKMLVLPDHPSPICTRTHSDNPVPFLLYKKGSDNKSRIDNFNEYSVEINFDIYIENGYELLDFVLAQ